MAQPDSQIVLETVAPCPRCGYDLRGHPDTTRCPECGWQVHVGAAVAEAAQWVDLRLLDLWSIGVLQTVGCAAALLTLFAIHRGHYVALILGMLALLSISLATFWFLALLPAMVWRTRRPFMRALGLPHLRRMCRWCVVDALLVTLAPLLFLFW